MVELARKCDELIQLVRDRGNVIKELDKATAVLQRAASMYPKVRGRQAGRHQGKTRRHNGGREAPREDEQTLRKERQASREDR